MVAGDVGICVAGDKHFIANTSDAPVTYFVVTVGPPEGQSILPVGVCQAEGLYVVFSKKTTLAKWSGSH
jgi:hypothetical protein